MQRRTAEDLKTTGKSDERTSDTPRRTSRARPSANAHDGRYASTLRVDRIVAPDEDSSGVERDENEIETDPRARLKSSKTQMTESSTSTTKSPWWTTSSNDDESVE